MMALLFDKADAQVNMSATIQASGVSEEGLEVTVVGTATGDRVEELRDRIAQFFRGSRVTPVSKKPAAELPVAEGEVRPVPTMEREPALPETKPEQKAAVVPAVPGKEGAPNS